MTRPAAPSVRELGEERLVRALRQVLDRPGPCSVANGDDALVWQPQGQVVATVDSVVQGVDWLDGVTPAEAIGHRAAAVNLSDLAAMGARPQVLLLAVECPGSTSSALLVRAARGLAALAERHGSSVQGGDVGVSEGPLRLTVTALGDLQGPALLRAATRPGDQLWLIGKVGWAGLGLAWLRAHGTLPEPGHWAEPFVQAHLWPQPLVGAGRALQALAAAGQRIGCIDISDGLGLDASRLARASGVGAVLELPAPQWPPQALQWLSQAGLAAEDLCASGGDDYALLVSAPPDVDLVQALGDRCGPVALVGVAVIGPKGKVHLSVGGVAARTSGWLHGA